MKHSHSEYQRVHIMHKDVVPSRDPGSDLVARRQRRRRKLKSGSILCAESAFSAECLVKDFHSSGAKLAFESTANIPDRFTLVIPSDGTEVECEVLWKGPQEVGVEFVSPALVDYRHIRQKPRQFKL